MLFEDDGFFAKSICARCGKKFVAMRGVRYCSEACRANLMEYQCVHCSKRFVKKKRSKAYRFCGAEHYKEYRRIFMRMEENCAPHPVLPMFDILRERRVYVDRVAV